MRLTQELLRDQVIRRIRAARPELTGLDLADLVALQAEMAARSNTVVCCVVRRLDIGSFARGVCAFAGGLVGERASAWRRSFTRTIFLAGNPENLTGRFQFAHVTPDRLAAWTQPSTIDSSRTLSRLLKLFDGPYPLPPEPARAITLPGPRGRTRELYLSTAGVTIADTLVHLNHLLAEAVLDGVIGPRDRLVLRQVPRLVGVAQPFEALRVGLDPVAPDRLRAFAGLTKEIA